MKVFPVLVDCETRFRIPPILISMGKFGLGLLFVTHVFAVAYAFVKKTEKLQMKLEDIM